MDLADRLKNLRLRMEVASKPDIIPGVKAMNDDVHVETSEHEDGTTTQIVSGLSVGTFVEPAEDFRFTIAVGQGRKHITVQFEQLETDPPRRIASVLSRTMLDETIAMLQKARDHMVEEE